MDERDEHGLPIWPAAERNKEPIFEEIRSLVREQSGVLLEIASATGQHALHFAERLPQIDYVPSDYDEQHLETLRKRIELRGLPNLSQPLRIDVTEEKWPIERADFIYNANMVHIAPWEVALGLFRGAGKLLSKRGLLMTYGPYRIDGKHTSESNEKFDASLKSRDPRWGVRDLGELADAAFDFSMVLVEKRALPANNLFVIWEKL
jgi:hypothetical protein